MTTGARRVSGNGKRSATARAAAILMGAVLLAAAAGCAAVGTPRATVAAARNSGSRDAAHSTGGRAKSGAVRTQADAACDPTAASLRPPAGPPRVTPGSWMATIRQRGHLIAGVSASTFNFGYFNPINGQYQGFDIDMIKAVATAIFGTADGHVQYKSITDDQRQPDIINGTVDIVAETMTINCKRLKSVDFSSVYFDANTRVLVLKNSTATGLASLGGQKVCATSGSTSAGIISSYPVTPRLKLVSVKQFTDCLVLLQQGQIAAISTDDSILAGLNAQDPFTKVVGPPFDPQPYGLAISKQHPDFVQFVNAVLAQERADNGWATSYKKWVGTPVPAPPVAQYAD
jgi:polar amino acid transport system substrate-binding protein